MKNMFETSLAAKSREIKIEWKKVAVIACLLFAICAPIFAEDATIEQLDNFGDKIVEILNAKWLKAILLVALVGEAIGMVLAGQKGGGAQIIQRFGPWIIGTVILLCAGPIVQFFFGSATIKIE